MSKLTKQVFRPLLQISTIQPETEYVYCNNEPSVVIVIGHIYIRSSSVKILNILFSESLQPSSALTYEGFFFAVSLVFIGWLSWPMKDIPSLHHEKLFCCVFAKQFAKWWNVWWIWLNWSTKNTFVSPAALSDYILSFFFPFFEVYQCCAPFNKPSEVH